MMLRGYRISLVIAVALAALAGVLFLLSGPPQPVQAGPVGTTRCVTPTGSGCNTAVCGGTCYSSVQAAVDASNTGDEVLVATGTYTGVHARNGMTQVVYISRTVAIRGGYSGDFTTRDPAAFPTTLDAQGQGRVVTIWGSDIEPELDGLIVTGGDATGVTAYCPSAGGPPDGCGGGIMVIFAQALIANNVISSNVAALSAGGHSGGGGGIALVFANGTVISNNLILNNYASTGDSGTGGGILLSFPYHVLVVSNRIASNTATTHPSLWGWGGGIAIDGSGAVVTVTNNVIEGNRTNSANTGAGAGVYSWYSTSVVTGNLVTGNHGSQAVYLGYHQRGRFEANQVVGNDTSTGIFLEAGAPGGSTLINNIVGSSGGTSFAAETYSGSPLTATLLHNTLAGSGTGYGVYVGSGEVTLVLTNNIVANHAWGITNTVPATSTVMADHTLFFGNLQNGIEGTNPVYGNPAFRDPGGRDYHIRPSSAAVDAAVPTAVDGDVDGERRPIGAGVDIGADEAWLPVFLPLVTRNY